MGVSRETKARWSLFSLSMSVARDGSEEEMALVEASMVRGSWVKVSTSMVAVGVVRCSRVKVSLVIDSRG